MSSTVAAKRAVVVKEDNLLTKKENQNLALDVSKATVKEIQLGLVVAVFGKTPLNKRLGY